METIINNINLNNINLTNDNTYFRTQQEKNNSSWGKIFKIKKTIPK